jgi:ATP-dependent DNA helicase PIF1
MAMNVVSRLIWRMMDIENIEINERFAQALDLMQGGDEHVFITGKAGTGKSTLLQHFRESTERIVVLLAPTGVAAVNIGGQTVHSFFKFKPGITPDSAERSGKIASRTKRGKLYKKLDSIIIDEISMVRADLFDCVDLFLRNVRGRVDEPFGGVRMIMIGDLHQLPPVVTSKERDIFAGHYDGPYFFNSRVYGEMSLELVELEKVYRQSDDEFIGLLGGIRNKTITDDELKILNARYQPSFDPGDELYVHLTTTNKAAAEVNKERLTAISGKAKGFHAEIDGEFKRDVYPSEKILSLKKGAQVMLLNNDPLKRWVNGTIGEVLELSGNRVRVELSDGSREWVEPNTWELYHFELDSGGKSIQSKVVGAFTQLPLKLAWAITIHKSQGKTFDRVIVDLGRGTFAPGQLYVALSRCRTLEGMVLKTRVNRSHAIVDGRVIKFLADFDGDQLGEELSKDDRVAQIEDAIRQGHCLAITYLKANDEKSCRIIEPRRIGAMEFSGRMFLGVRARCLLRQSERVFRLDRIVKMDVLKKMS